MTPKLPWSRPRAPPSHAGGGGGAESCAEGAGDSEAAVTEGGRGRNGCGHPGEGGSGEGPAVLPVPAAPGRPPRTWHWGGRVAWRSSTGRVLASRRPSAFGVLRTAGPHLLAGSRQPPSAPARLGRWRLPAARPRTPGIAQRRGCSGVPQPWLPARGAAGLSSLSACGHLSASAWWILELFPVFKPNKVV